MRIADYNGFTIETFGKMIFSPAHDVIMEFEDPSLNYLRWFGDNEPSKAIKLTSEAMEFLKHCGIGSVHREFITPGELDCIAAIEASTLDEELDEL